MHSLHPIHPTDIYFFPKKPSWICQYQSLNNININNSNRKLKKKYQIFFMDFHVYRNNNNKKKCVCVLCMLSAVQQEKKKKSSEPLTDRIDLES